MKFLETITLFGHDVLVPIDRIQYINYKADDNGYKITIKSDDGDWVECFESKEFNKAAKRYRMIKEIVEAK